MELIATKLPYKGAMSSLIGGRNENQDTVGYSETARGMLFVVCDGMGGGPGGKTASLIATKAIIGYVKTGAPVPGLVKSILFNNDAAPVATPDAGALPYAPSVQEAGVPMPSVDSSSATSKSADDNETILQDAVCYANACLREAIQYVPALRGMGTTTTAVLIDGDRAVLAHVGDSRIYQLRGAKKMFRTADHSMVGEWRRAGKLKYDEQMRLSAQSNIITRALGSHDEVEVDIDVRPYEAGDRFILCTDGIWGSMPEEDLIELIAGKDINTVFGTLNKEVESIGQNKGGKHDNYSAIIFDTHQNSELKEKASPKTKIIGLVIAAVCVLCIIIGVVVMLNHKPAQDASDEQTTTEEVVQPNDDAPSNTITE